MASPVLNCPCTVWNSCTEMLHHSSHSQSDNICYFTHTHPGAQYLELRRPMSVSRAPEGAQHSATDTAAFSTLSPSRSNPILSPPSRCLVPHLPLPWEVSPPPSRDTRCPALLRGVLPAPTDASLSAYATPTTGGGAGVLAICPMELGSKNLGGFFNLER